MYVPAAQAVHPVWPAFPTNMPALHSMHEVAPAAVLYCPAAQSMHAEAASVGCNPTAAAPEYFPVSQSLQEVAPPNPQTCWKLLPNEQTTVESEYLPAGQSWHKLDDPFFPAGHGVHSGASVAVYPSAQLLQVRPTNVWPLLQHVSWSHEHLSLAQWQSPSTHTEFLHPLQLDHLQSQHASIVSTSTRPRHERAAILVPSRREVQATV